MSDARAMNPVWVRDLYLSADVPFFFKHWGGTNKKRAGGCRRGGLGIICRFAEFIVGLYRNRMVKCLGVDPAIKKWICTLSVTNPLDIPDDLDLPSRYYCLFVAIDANSFKIEDIGFFAEKMLLQGAVYICSWGPGCEMVHDCFDDVVVRDNLGVSDQTVILTTWHENESIDDAVWFTARVAEPAGAYAKDSQTVLYVVIGNQSWVEKVNGAVVNQMSTG